MLKHFCIVLVLGATQAVCPLLACAGELDLSSTQRTACGRAGMPAVTIKEGGATRVVNAGDLLTPAELVAVHQVLAKGQQSLLLSSLGSAVGGRFDAGKLLSRSGASGLVIPAGVTAVRDFAAGALVLPGSLNNAGTFLAVSSNLAVRTASLSALNIINQSGGTITSVLPAGGLSGYTGLIANLDLKLNAVQNVINNGFISSPGSLNINAGRSISNSFPAGTAALTPAVTAGSNLSLQAPLIVNQGLLAARQGTLAALTTGLSNSGMMQSPCGNLTVSSSTAELSVQNTTGVISARDSLNFATSSTGSAACNPAASLSVTGGQLSAADISFDCPGGNISVAVDRLAGPVRLSGGNASVGVGSGSLAISGLSISGDPIFYNSGGGLDLDWLTDGSTFSTGGGDFVALASGDLTASHVTTGATVDASAAGGPGGKITLSAGNDFTVSGGPSPIACSNCTGNFSLSGFSTATGGNIKLPGVNFKTNSSWFKAHANWNGSSSRNGDVELGDITTSANDATGSGGLIEIVGTGKISTGNLLALGGSTSGAGGDISVRSFSPSGYSPGLTTGNILTSAGSGGIAGWSVCLFANGPITTTGTLFDAYGSRTSGTAGYFLLQSRTSITLPRVSGADTIMIGTPVLNLSDKVEALNTLRIDGYGGPLTFVQLTNNTGAGLQCVNGDLYLEGTGIRVNADTAGNPSIYAGNGFLQAGSQIKVNAGPAGAAIFVGWTSPALPPLPPVPGLQRGRSSAAVSAGLSNYDLTAFSGVVLRVPPQPNQKDLEPSVFIYPGEGAETATLAMMTPGQGSNDRSGSLLPSSRQLGAGLTAWTGGNCSFDTDGSVVRMNRGEALFESRLPSVLSAGSCLLSLGSGVLALVSLEDDIVVVRNLCEDRKSSLSVYLGSQRVFVPAGSELRIASSEKRLLQSLSRDPVPRRRLSVTRLVRGGFAGMAELPPPALFQSCRLLNRLMHDRGDAQRRLSARLLKMAVCLQLTTQGHGVYSPASLPAR